MTSPVSTRPGALRPIRPEPSVLWRRALGVAVLLGTMGLVSCRAFLASTPLLGG